MAALAPTARGRSCHSGSDNPTGLAALGHVQGLGRGKVGVRHGACGEDDVAPPPTERFPLHCMVFKQLACHLPHEANVEQYFSRAGNFSDPKLSPAYLGVLV